MKQKRYIAETTGLVGDHFFLLALVFESVDYFSHVISILTELSIRKELVVIKGTAEMSRIALHFLQKNILNIIDDEGDLGTSEMLLFKELLSNFQAQSWKSFIIYFFLRENISDIYKTRRNFFKSP